MKKYKIGIWGQSGGGGKIADGQSVRTTVITQELKKKYGEKQILFTDTYNWKKRPFGFFKECIDLIKKSENIIILPADNGFKIFVPIIIFLNIFFRRRLIYIVIGGFLPKLLKTTPFYIKLVNKFDIIFVQTNTLKKDLEMIGIKNIHILSNLKRLNTRKPEDIKLNIQKKIKLCVFSRITKEKGIEEAIEAIKITNKKLGGEYVKLDFYGLLQESYKKRFQKLIFENKNIIAYKGVVYFNKTVETLQNYFALIFPTYYYGEGFPGNVIDVYNTGIPIIATDWLYNSDVIIDGVNGILVPIKDPISISKSILKLYYDRELVVQMGLNNLEASKKYHPDKVLKELYQFIENEYN